MSHFTVLVIGEDHDYQLAPFHEFECTGLDDEFVVEVDKTDEVRAEYEKSWGEYTSIEQCAEDYFGIGGSATYSRVEGAGTPGVKFIRRTNPNAKWDYYSVGGRWEGYLLLKDGTRADVALKRDVDVEGMRNAAGEKAAERYDKVRPAIEPHLKSYRSWESVRTSHPDTREGLDAARKEYREQPAVAALEATELGGLFGPTVDDFLPTREEYVQRFHDGALPTHSLLKDREWFQRGRMGWFGFSDDEMTREEWNEKFSEMFDALPDDARITVVDCHI